MPQVLYPNSKDACIHCGKRGFGVTVDGQFLRRNCAVELGLEYILTGILERHPNIPEHLQNRICMALPQIREHFSTIVMAA